MHGCISPLLMDSGTLVKCVSLCPLSQRKSPALLSATEASTSGTIFKVFRDFSEKNVFFQVILFTSKVGFLRSCLLSWSSTRGASAGWTVHEPTSKCNECRVKLIQASPSLSLPPRFIWLATSAAAARVHRREGASRPARVSSFAFMIQQGTFL